MARGVESHVISSCFSGSASYSAAHDSLCLTGDGDNECHDQSQILIGLVATIRHYICSNATCLNDWRAQITLFTSETSRRRDMVQNKISTEMRNCPYLSNCSVPVG